MYTKYVFKHFVHWRIKKNMIHIFVNGDCYTFIFLRQNCIKVREFWAPDFHSCSSSFIFLLENVKGQEFHNFISKCHEIIVQCKITKNKYKH